MGNCAKQCTEQQELYIRNTTDEPARREDTVIRKKIQTHIPAEKSLV